MFFNRAPFSFDLSLFDLAIAPTHGHALFALDRETEESLAKTFQALSRSGLSLWVSTPSFLNLCLADPSFGPELLPRLNTVVVCGETLHHETACKLLERFPGVRLFNSYGPTETQGAVADVLVTPQLLEQTDVLPVGIASPYSEIAIVDPDTKRKLPCGQAGEVRIGGATLAKGYFGKPEQTKAAFVTLPVDDGPQQDLPLHDVPQPDAPQPDAPQQHITQQRVYLTGDRGWLDQDGMLWFQGRFDNQVKVNGFRIELQEIEEALNRLPEVVESCAVVATRGGIAQSIAAHVSLAEGVPTGRATTKALKEQLKQALPAYMIPRTFVYHDQLPKTANGKVDRKALSQGDA